MADLDRVERVGDVDRPDALAEPAHEHQVFENGRVVRMHHRPDGRAGRDRLGDAVADHAVGHGVRADHDRIDLRLHREDAHAPLGAGAERLGELQSSDGGSSANSPGRTATMASPVPRSAGELRDGPPRTVSDLGRDGLARALRGGRPEALHPCAGFPLPAGGERRRTEIARCLAIEPRFILLDEPFAGIDPIAVIDIQRILQKLRERGIGVLITDHNVRETLAITDRAYIINDGKIFRAGTPEELTGDEEVKRVYLGENFRM